MNVEIKTIMRKYIGPGGVHCHCCNKFYRKNRKKLNRLIRHKMSNNLCESLKKIII